MENVIKSIDENSPLHAHARPGDRLISINGNRILDVLDYKYFAYDPHLTVVLEGPDGARREVHILLHRPAAQGHAQDDVF